MKHLAILVLALCAACASVTKITPVVATPDGLGHWFVLTDAAGGDHVLFCEAKPLHLAGAIEPAACYDLTPREGKAVGSMGVPYRSQPPP